MSGESLRGDVYTKGRLKPVTLIFSGLVAWVCICGCVSANVCVCVQCLLVCPFSKWGCLVFVWFNHIARTHCYICSQCQYTGVIM